ncbi:trans-sialidase [Trypanosoma cruzi Dm28c]|uniref:Trans-sialidase n=2 Tax=Trypanosoma cruzi TaxID=5693 RepID=V5CWD8_TRYCR|nr:trans-sialidase [Trypanosoma cruzi Dm28c]PBJ76943.1 trans-sialidase [Trypanosoma cruzi cruzi]PWV01861.1 putative trans-sialidase, Group VI [Trypanosoma cruzi]
MLSRAAAVKAPRTHSRRRVTGSSGRRREGRESEPQRPNMSRHHFCSALLFLFLVVCCGTGGASSSEVTAPGSGNAKTYFDWRDVKVEEETVSSLRVPSLVEMNGDVFAVAEALCTRKKDTVEGSFTGIASELLELTGEKKEEELDKSKLKTQVLDKCPFEGGNCPSQTAAKEGGSQSETKVHVSRPTTVVDGSDIYMLAGNYSNKGVSEDQAGDWGLLLVSGNVSTVDSKKRIYWNDTYGLPSAFFEKQHKSLTQLTNGGGSGIKMNDGTLVFPVEATKKETNNEDEVKTTTVSLIIHSSDNAASWKLSKGMSADGCSELSVVEWEKDKLIMMTACDGGRRRVYESGDMGESWTEALGTLSRVWGNKKGETVEIVRSGFTTATIDGDDKRNVMLVTLPVYAKETDKKEKGELHLWLTDNTHIVDIGPVSDDDAAASSLLYKSAGSGDNEQKEELIALYEKKKKEDGKPSPGMVSVRLTAQLQHVKDVLSTWKKVDETVSMLCPSSAEKDDDASPYTACSPTVKITDGLVGFLSGNFSDGTWRDEYLGVNARVKGNNDEGKKATLHEDGVKFTGAWAEWPVGAQGENQLYHFANYNFTLVATVSIDKVPEGSPIPLMGVKMNDNENPVLLGLSYDSEKKWIVFCGGGQNKEHSSDWEPGRTHQLAIVLQNGKQGSAYVDGILVGNAQCNLQDMDSKAVSHFYIGGDGGAKSDSESRGGVSVTVTNVLLYNRPLSTAEIGALNPNKASSPSVVPDNGQGTVSQSSSAGQLPSEQGQQKGSIAAGAGGASTPVTSTAAASSGQEPVKQLTSGTSPSGNKNADASFSSDADPTVVTVGGETVQGDGSLQTPEVSVGSGEDEEATGRTDGQEDNHAHNGEVNATALSSSLGNVSQGNNSDAGTVCESRMLPSLLLLGLWVFAAL